MIDAKLHFMPERWNTIIVTLFLGHIFVAHFWNTFFVATKLLMGGGGRDMIDARETEFYFCDTFFGTLFYTFFWDTIFGRFFGTLCDSRDCSVR